MDFTSKIILVIGASGGLGREFSKQLALNGARVIGTARTLESAERIQNCEQRILLDLMDPNSIQAVANYLVGNYRLDGIVNAAGVVAFGPAEMHDSSVLESLTQTNFLGPAKLFSLLKANLEQSGGFVLNVTGIVADTPLPNMAPYSASKSAIHGFLTAAAREWRRSGVRVHSSLLGHTETGLSQRPIFGTAPAFPQGKSPEMAVSELLASLN